MKWFKWSAHDQLKTWSARWSAWQSASSQGLQSSPWTKSVIVTSVLLTLAISTFWLARAPLQQLHDQLAMRPNQWSALGQLVAQIRTPVAGPRMVATLDEVELNLIRNLLIQRGLKPTVFQLTSDNPPRIQMQVSGVLFASLIDFLEDLRKTRNLYPVRANVQATSALGVVNASLTLEQMK